MENGGLHSLLLEYSKINLQVAKFYLICMKVSLIRAMRQPCNNVGVYPMAGIVTPVYSATALCRTFDSGVLGDVRLMLTRCAKLPHASDNAVEEVLVDG